MALDSEPTKQYYLQYRRPDYERKSYLTTNEQTVERVVDRFQAAGQLAAADGIRVLGQVAQDLLDLCIEAEPNEPFAWAAIEDAITALRSLLK